jgi:hypothetical protein
VKDNNSYVLPKRLLRIIIHRINKATTNENVRSAANKIAHMIGQYHAAPGTFHERANNFWLCRTQVCAKLDVSEHYFKLAIAVLEVVGFLKIVERFKPTRRADGSILCKPTEYAIASSFQPFFPAAQMKLNFAERTNLSSMLSRVQEKAKKVFAPASRVHTGDGEKLTHPGTTHHPVLGHDTGPVKGFNAYLDAVVASVREARA